MDSLRGVIYGMSRIYGLCVTDILHEYIFKHDYSSNYIYPKSLQREQKLREYCVNEKITNYCSQQVALFSSRRPATKSEASCTTDDISIRRCTIQLFELN